MKSRIHSLGTVIFALALTGNQVFSQDSDRRAVDIKNSSADPWLQSVDSLIETGGDPFDTVSAPVAFVKPNPPAISNSLFRPFSRLGIASRAGFAGVGFDLATPLARRFNLRAGSDFFGYSDTFQEQGANVAINLHMQTAHSSLDWFPFNGGFRLSPQIVFANNNRVQAIALIPSGSNITLNGQNYVSSLSDPLHGVGLIHFRKVSPSITFGFGNLIPRKGSRFSVPIEAGFYYTGQPGLKVSFSGSACDPTQAPAIGCQSVTQDASFQQNLDAFIARNNHNLSYASFFPIFSIGFGYAF
jgi:hypothetical protein